MLGGVSLAQNTFHAREAASVTLAPALAGDVIHYELAGRLLVQSASYLVSGTTIELDIRFDGGRTFLTARSCSDRT